MHSEKHTRKGTNGSIHKERRTWRDKNQMKNTDRKIYTPKDMHGGTHTKQYTWKDLNGGTYMESINQYLIPNVLGVSIFTRCAIAYALQYRDTRSTSVLPTSVQLCPLCCFSVLPMPAVRQPDEMTFKVDVKERVRRWVMRE